MQNNRMVSISMSDLLKEKNGLLPKIVVVQGVPGIGKSTFAWKFCRKWAKGKIYQQYHLVVLLRMRDTRVREATKLSDLFFSEIERQSKDVAEEIFGFHGKNVLIFLEGIDELPVSCLADGTPLSNLLQGESLPEVTILATSRPWAVKILEEKCGNQISRQVEILGFTREDILKYVSHAFTEEEEQTEFLQYLQSQPQLESIMHIPLNAEFVVQIYKQFHRSRQTIPNTLTQLYTALVEGLLLRYMKSNPDYKQLGSLSLESLPEPVKTHFQQLCLLAFMSFTKLTVQVTFTDSEAALYDCFDFLGLMQSSTEPTVNTGTIVTHSFLHFTIQEFLAAYHLSNEPQNIQITFLEVHSQDPQFRMIFTFLVGLNSNVLHCLTLPEANKLLPFHLHLLYESQSPQDVCKFLGRGSVKYYPTLTSTSFDLHALSYCLCHSDCFWCVKISLKNLSSHLYSNSSGFYNGSIVQIVLTNASKQAIQLFFTLPRRIFVSIDFIRIGALEPINSAVQEIFGDKKFANLSKITIFNGYTPGCHSTPLLNCLCHFHSKLVHIGVYEASYSDMIVLCKYIQSRSSEFTLAFSKSVFFNDSLKLLISTLPSSKNLTHLDLSYSFLSAKEVEMISVALSANTSLKSLGLANCSINGEGIELLSNELEENHTLLGLDLRRNGINTHGAAALASMLAVNTSLKILYLSHNKEMGQVGALRLIGILQQENKILQQLTLPAECEPIEYGSILMDDISKSGRIKFISKTDVGTDTIAHNFASIDVWPYI